MRNPKITRYDYRVLQHLIKHGSINHKEANDLYGVSRLSAAIWNLIHKHGYLIVGEFESGQNRYSETVAWKNYRLVHYGTDEWKELNEKAKIAGRKPEELVEQLEIEGFMPSAEPAA